jgi:hypothetical protein
MTGVAIAAAKGKLTAETATAQNPHTFPWRRFD